MYSAIRFPGLGLEFNPNPVAFEVFGLEIKWYGILIAFGFLLAIIYCFKHANEYGLSSDDLLDVLIFAIPAAIVGARLYFVLFHIDYFSQNPGQIFNTRGGGLAIYGGILGALLAAWFVARYKRKKKSAVIKTSELFDIGAFGLLIGQAVGRWGNFVNREAYGTVTSLPWRMELESVFGGYMQGVHPCFLYESVWNAIGFVILHFVAKKRKFDGQIFLMYVAWYGLGRAIIEQFRTDSLYFFGLRFFGQPIRVSQWLAALSCAAAIVLLVLFYRRGTVADIAASIKKADTSDGQEQPPQFFAAIEHAIGEEDVTEDGDVDEPDRTPPEGQPSAGDTTNNEEDKFEI